MLRIRKRTRMSAPPAKWPNGSECYVAMGNGERLFAGWSIQTKEGVHRFFSSENGQPKFMGDFKEFHTGMTQLSDAAIKKLPRKNRTRATPPVDEVRARTRHKRKG